MPPEPVCPDRWTCTFKYSPAKHIGPWWEGPWGVVLTILGLVVLAVVLITALYYAYQHRQAALDAREQRELREHKLAIEEQRTMRLDAANAIVREMQQAGDPVSAEGAMSAFDEWDATWGEGRRKDRESS